MTPALLRRPDDTRIGPIATATRRNAERFPSCSRARRCCASVLLGATLLAWAGVGAAQTVLLQEVIDGVGGVDGLNGVRHIAVSPDGRHLYAAANDDSAVSVFEILPSGLLQFVQVLKDGSSGGVDDGLQNARHLAISPDGANVYVASYNEFAASAFARDPMDGRLAFVNEVPNPPCCSTFTSLNEVAVSPDGANVYTVSNGYAAALARGVGGAIALIDGYSESSDSFGRGFALAVSPDGGHVYIGHDAYLDVAARGAGGELSFVVRYQDGFGGLDFLNGPEAIAISPDGLDVYVGTYNDSSINHFQRDPASGLLSFQEASVDPSSCPDVNELLMFPDGSGLLASCLTTFALYERSALDGSLQLVASVPQENIGATQIYSVAIAGDTVYVASEGTDRILVLPEAGSAAAGALAVALLGGLSRRRPRPR